MGIHVCVTNPSAFNISLKSRVYGNKGGISDSDETFWGKSRDLYALKPDDLLIFYVKEQQKLYGIYKVRSMPFIFGDNLFGSKNQKYPYRFYFEQHKNYPNGIPVFEFYSLVEKGLVNSISSFERDITASYRGIRQLFTKELGYIVELFRKYNPKSDPDDIWEPQIVQNHRQVEADVFHRAFLSKGKFSIHDLNEPLEILFNRIPQKNNFARYETVLQTYINYHLLHDGKSLREQFNLERLTEVIIEAPIFQSMQFRTDLLVLYSDSVVNYFHSFIELKRDRKIYIDDLSQLIGYLKSYASSKNLSQSSYEGIFVSTSFKDEAIDYLRNRLKVEQENIVKLFTYEVKKGEVFFKRLI